MKFSEYISCNQVFTTQDLLGACDSAAAAEEQLRLAVRSGSVERARRGLLVSNHGRFEGAPVDPLSLVMAADADAIVSYHSACEAHGVAHNVSFTCQFRSDRVKSPFAFRGIDYEPCGPVGDASSTLLRSGGGRVRVATREQTIVDCLDRPILTGGSEEAVRCASSFIYIDPQALLAIVRARGAATAARTGWLLSCKADDWHIDDALLHELKGMLKEGPYRLGRPNSEHKGWSAKWRLILPEPIEEVESWITRS